MAGPRIAGEGPEIWHHAGAHRVEVNVPDQFQEIRLRLDHDGAVPVLEKMPDPVVAAVEVHHVPGEEAAHPDRQWGARGPNEEVGMIGKRRPGMHRPGTLRHEVRKPSDEIGAVGVLAEDGGPLDSPDHHAVGRVGRI